MKFKRVLIANRGEIALRIIRALHELGIESVAVYAEDDLGSMHRSAADLSVPLNAAGPAAYLGMAGLLDIALQHGCDAVHPGYGFLSESAVFARACRAKGIRFIGPTPNQLELFGDKARARALAMDCGVPVLPGTSEPVSLEEAREFFRLQAGAPIVVKAVSGGGGRGIRLAHTEEELERAYESCQREAQAASGKSGVYVEKLLTRARHVEVQVIGDGTEVIALGERDCSIQRRFQKVVEVAPSPALSSELRGALAHAALRMAGEVGYEGLGTFEFLVDLGANEPTFAFMEVNPRLQVEHTITEEVFGVDLVTAQIELARGASLRSLGLTPDSLPRPRGFAIQWRINAEALDGAGNAMPSSGRLGRFDLPTGPGVRVDTHAVAGTSPSPHYDSLLAKVIVHCPGGFSEALRRSRRVLGELRIEGVSTNLPVLRALSRRPEIEGFDVDTKWLETIQAELVSASDRGDAGADNPFSTDQANKVADRIAPPNTVVASLPARLVQFNVKPGDVVAAGSELAIMEAMKMEHVVTAPYSGRVLEFLTQEGSFLDVGAPLLVIEPGEDVESSNVVDTGLDDPDFIRPDLRRMFDRIALTLDSARPEAMQKRRSLGSRSARENIEDLCDEGTFIEYGALAVAAQSSRRSEEELQFTTPADGIITGIGSVNGKLFGEDRAQTAVLAYDATVLAGTQGVRNHAKTDRMLRTALDQRLPVVLFAEGGGGRPGDDGEGIRKGLALETFAAYGALSGQVPVIGIVHRRCFAGNAALVGCSDVIIATKDSNIGMGGPAMIEGGGLGVFAPEEIGPSAVQYENGVVDVLASDEAEAVSTARHYLSFFQGALRDWTCPDQRLLRRVVPENRLRVYDTRDAIGYLADEGSVLFLRPGFGLGIHTALARLEGRTVGVVANNPMYLGGAIDAPAADKAARFMQLCDAHGIPIVSLIDTPGFMVGPEVEKTAQVRHVSRLFVTAANLRVPYFSVVLRKGYGLGAMAMAAGGFHEPVFTIAWPTGEFGGMGLEGYVRLGYKKELEALPAGVERDALFQRLLAQRYKEGEALSMASKLEIDAVIDPAETRAWLLRGLKAARRDRAETSARRFIDTW